MSFQAPEKWGSPYYEKWTWETFTSYAKIITDAKLGGPGYFFTSGYDEELFLTMMVSSICCLLRNLLTCVQIAHNWGEQLIFDNYTCGVQNQRFYDAMDATLVQWLRDGSLNQYFAVTNLTETEFTGWLREVQ
jgi:hypothetical protein